MRIAPTSTAPALSNAEIASRLSSVAQLLAARKENPFKVRAYRRAAETIASMSESVDALVRNGGDLTAYSGIGKGISGAVREIVLEGKLRQLDRLRTELGPELAAFSEFPRLDPKRVLQIYQKLNISSLEALREKLEQGEIGAKLGYRLEQHVRQALVASDEILLYDADRLVPAVDAYLRKKCGVKRAIATGDFRRRVEVIRELSFLIETRDFAAVVEQLKHYGGRTELLHADAGRATFKLPVGLLLAVELAPPKRWGLALLRATGSEAHLEKLTARGYAKLERSKKPLPTEAAVYRELRLRPIPPELREGNDEVARAARAPLPKLVTVEDIRGELHCHSTSSDGAQSVEKMAAAAQERGYEFLGITDHSQSLKIARGVSIDDLWRQIRRIDQLNEKLRGFRILKSAEVDILADGTLDYPDDLLAALDYTVCSIHSKFGLNKAQQTERILRAMDNPHFTILGHATGRLLLRRPGYEIDIERIVAHAKARGCFFEINSSPDRLDLRVEHARLAHAAGIKIAVCTDAHSVGEFDFISCGIDVARRAGLDRKSVLNCLSWPELQRTLRR